MKRSWTLRTFAISVAVMVALAAVVFTAYIALLIISASSARMEPQSFPPEDPSDSFGATIFVIDLHGQDSAGTWMGCEPIGSIPTLSMNGVVELVGPSGHRIRSKNPFYEHNSEPGCLFGFPFDQVSASAAEYELVINGVQVATVTPKQLYETPTFHWR